MNPYEESLLHTRGADLERETRTLQLSGESGATPESETEVFRFATMKRVGGRIERWFMTIARWQPRRRSPAVSSSDRPAKPVSAAAAARPAREPTSVPTPIK